LCFGEAGAETLWTSEIEPFCRKVVEYHFGKENEDDDRR
jgi:site-specific DNA-cytosine methylase